mmetsp:Transcript_76731/g.211982  ORF Transcript_76731/g.211982 Transcript_76731/m.211982 type:complete len:386 (+) Transcript_76731:130-1287(+)
MAVDNKQSAVLFSSADVNVKSCWYDERCLGISDYKHRSSRGCFSFEACCFFDALYGSHCFNQASGFTYQRCCSLNFVEGNERYIPFWHSQQVLIELHSGSALVGHGRVLDASGSHYLQLLQRGTTLEEYARGKGDWSVYEEDKVALVLWRSAYAMMRWLEQLMAPPSIFQGRRVLELGAGIGLLSLVAALGGAESVTATDASSRALALIRRNARNALPAGRRRALAARRLDWTNVSRQAAGAGAARAVAVGPPRTAPHSARELGWQALRRAGVQGPAFDVVICSALGYVPPRVFRSLLCVLDLITSSKTLVLWGGGASSTNDLNASRSREAGAFDERTAALLQGFRIVDRARGLDLVMPEFRSYKLRRREDWRGGCTHPSDTGHY